MKHKKAHQTPNLWSPKKLTTVLLLVGSIGYTNPLSAQTIRMQVEKGNLDQALKRLTEQTDVQLVYSPDVARRIEIKAMEIRTSDINLALNDILQGTNLFYEIQNGIYLIKRRSENIQKDRIYGRVLDIKGKPLAGATIIVKGAGYGAMANKDGYFELRDVKIDQLDLEFTCLGMKSFTQKVKTGVTFEVYMHPNTEDLSEVVVTGYATIEKERMTGAYGMVNQNQLDKPSTNIGTRLIGTVAGLVGKQDANGNPTFEVRGQTSLYANAQPLIVVDGYAIEGGLSSINPNDVQSITVLKDAAAASIWGARSANGVIVVTTKSPKRTGTARVELNSFIQVSPKIDLNYLNPLATAAQTIDYERRSFEKWSPVINNGTLLNDHAKAFSLGSTALNEHKLGFFTQSELEQQLAYLSTLDNRQQLRAHLLNAPFIQQHNLSISSSNEYMNNNISLLFNDSDNFYKGNTNRQYMVNYRTNGKIYQWLEFNFSGMFQYRDNTNQGIGENTVRALSPYEMLINEQGTYTNIVKDYYWPIMERQVVNKAFPYSDWTYNPLSDKAFNHFDTQNLNTRLQTGLKINLLKSLSYDVKFQYERLESKGSSLYDEESYYVRNYVNTSASWDKTNNKITPNITKGSIWDQRRTEVEGLNFRNQLNFDHHQGKSEINALAGFELTTNRNKTFNSPTSYGYQQNTMAVGNFPNGVTVKDWMNGTRTFNYLNSFGNYNSKYFSVYGNAAYTYDRKYTLSASARTDASNLITDDPKYRYAPFWSIGGKWMLSNEIFFEKLKNIDHLALRATYGYNGNVDRSTSFMPLISIDRLPDPYTFQNTATIQSFGNPTLRWEKVGTTNLGIDYSLFGNKLYGKIDAYWKKGKDLIASITIPSANGTVQQKFNNAAMNNIGIELEVGTRQQLYDDKISWAGSVTFAYNKNKITDLKRNNYISTDLVGGGSAAYVEGENAQSIWAYRYAGIVDIGNSTTSNMQPAYYGPNGAPIAFGQSTIGTSAQTYLNKVGTSVPPYTLGLIQELKVYDFNISFILTGKFGHKFKGHSFNYPTISKKLLPNARYEEVLHADPMKMVPLPQNDIETGYQGWSLLAGNMDYLYQNANHVRLQEANLTYNVNPEWIKRMRIKGLQLYAQGNNLFVFTTNKYDEDPEYPLGYTKPTAQYTFGLRANL